jgi:hypothetical protein
MSPSQSAPDDLEKVSEAIQAKDVSHCYLCGSESDMLHANTLQGVWCQGSGILESAEMSVAS